MSALRAGAAALLVAMIALAPGRASADAAPSASQHAKVGQTRFAAEDYAGALVEFTAAEEAAPAAWHQWYIGHCQDHLQHYRAAVVAYEKLVAASPASLGKEAARVPEASERIAAIKAMPGALHLEVTPASAQLTVDGAEQTRSAPFDLTLAPGRHALRLAAPGFEAETMDLEVAYASKRTMSLSLHEVPVAPAVAPAPTPQPPATVASSAPSSSAPSSPAASSSASSSEWPAPRRTLGWTAAGLAVASAGFGTAFGIVALEANSSFEQIHTLGRAYRAQDFAVYSDVAFGAAVALGATSLVLLLGGGSSDAPRPAAPAAWTFQATPLTLSHGAGAGAVVRF